nr:zinc finger, CCHC-type [Tanacetum cinerariifolium]
MDVKTAFLNGDLEKEIYMNQPEGFIAPGLEGKVCRLVKSLYGLKQAPKQGHQKFDHAMLESGFKINESDNNDNMIKSTKVMLKSKFDIKNMGLADVIFGIKIIRTQNGLVLSQAHYVDKILNTRNAGDSSLARTPIDTSLHLSKNRGVAYAISRLSRYTSNLSNSHWKAMTRDSRSTSGYVFTLGWAAISWKAHSTMYNGKSRDIRHRHNSIIQLLSTGVISIDYVASKDNIADPFMKGLSRALVSKSSKEMGLKPLKE